MVFIPVPNTALVEVRYLIWGQRCENTLSFYRGGPIGDGDLQFISEKIADWWYYQLRTVQRNILSLREVYATDLTTEDGPTYTCSKWAGSLGLKSTGVATPSNVSFAVSFRTAGRGRSYRGRNFMAGLLTDYISGLQVTSTYRNLVIGIYQRLLPGGEYDPTPFRWVVASRWHNNWPRNPGIAIPIIAVVTSNDDIDSMRKRLAGRGL